MKIFLKLGLSALALLFLFSALAVTETKAQTGVLGEVLKRMDEHNKKLATLKASVRMDKYNAQIDTHDITEGSVTYAAQKGKNPYVRIDWTKPVEESLAVVNKEYVLYRPKLNQYIKGNINQAKGSGTAGGALAFINMSKAQLKANYTIRYVGQETASGAPTWHLELTPKAATNYKVAELWVDGNGMPIQAKVTENSGETTTIVLSNLQKNVTVNGSDFVINTKGAKEVKG
ncbi:MAG TPA: outer membrane lipoprotein carrier protein LolA [Pyrinomonadaceae bacterium]|jgi:outer membrane lipoprotein-sorting protein